MPDGVSQLDPDNELLPITVALLAYNQVATIEDAIESILSQTYPIDQLIISDDCSTDGTWGRINAYFANTQVPEAVVGDVVLRRNSRNLGLIEHNRRIFSIVRNELMVGHAGDDISHSDRLEKSVAVYQQLGCPRHFLLHTPVRIIDQPGNPVWVPPVVAQGLDLRAAALSQALHIGASSMLTRSLWADFNGIDYPEVFEDLVLGFRAYLLDAYHYHPEPLLDYRSHGGLSDPESIYNAGSSHEDGVRRVKSVYCQRMVDAARLGRQDIVDILIPAAAQLPHVGEAAGSQDKQEPGDYTYVPWLSSARWLPREKEWAIAEMAAWDEGSAPVPGFALAVLGHQTISADPTFESIEAQWLNCRCLDIGVREDVAATLGAANEALLGSGCDWLAVMDAGCRLAPDALFRVASGLREHPEWKLVYVDEDSIAADGSHENPHFKPDFDIDYLRSLPYVGGFLLVHRELFEALGGFDVHTAGVEEYDLLLRAWEHLQARGNEGGIGHLQGVYFHRQSGAGHVPSPQSDMLAIAQEVLRCHIDRLNIDASIESGIWPATFRVRYRHPEQPFVSIVVTTRNQREVLDRCVQSLLAHTAWPQFEIVVVDNDSREEDAVEFLDGLRGLEVDLGGRIRVLDCPGAANHSTMVNLAAREARGEYLLLLHSDTQALHSDWLTEMMVHAQRPEVGVVGAKLLFPDGKVQHAGVILGMGGLAGYAFAGRDAKDGGYYARLQVEQGYSAVSGACLLLQRDLFLQVGGMDERALPGAYADIDLCLRIRELGKRVIWSPNAVLMHEAADCLVDGSTGADEAGKQGRGQHAEEVMYQRWLPQMADDPSYNPNLTLANTEFLIEQDPALCWAAGWRPAPRIIAQAGDRMGCGEYRIIAPMRALVNAGRVQGQESQRIYTPPELARMQLDALVLQRQIETHQISAIERHKRVNQVFCVFEIDDLVTNLPVKSAHKKHMPKDMYKRLRRSVGLCDRLVVATDALAEAYGGLSSDIRVVPNFVEEARWGHLVPQRLTGRKPRVGWAGGISHTGDLELITSVLEELKDEVEWVFFGMCPERVRPFVQEFHPPVALEEYAEKLASLNLDLALAPLEDVPFNHAKSHLRLLEYGVLGYPVVCSDLTPYQGELPVTRVRNRHRDWVDAIRGHLADLDATQAQGDLLRDQVREHWLLENNLDVWLKAWLPD